MQVRDGVLWLRTSGTLLGYLNAAAPIDEAGWYCTGDLVEQEGEWIRILGRASELINVGGEKVSPGEVESTILELPFVATAVVSGEPHAMLGQIVVARLTVLQSESRSPAEIGAQVRRHCRGTLAGYKVPVKVHVLQGAGATERLKTDRASAALRPR